MKIYNSKYIVAYLMHYTVLLTFNMWRDHFRVKDKKIAVIVAAKNYMVCVKSII